MSSAVIKANPMQIMLATGNLLDNAIRHSPPQGRVIVTIESVNEGFRISVSDQWEIEFSIPKISCVGITKERLCALAKDDLLARRG